MFLPLLPPPPPLPPYPGQSEASRQADLIRYEEARTQYYERQRFTSRLVIWLSVAVIGVAGWAIVTLSNQMP